VGATDLDGVHVWSGSTGAAVQKVEGSEHVDQTA